LKQQVERVQIPAPQPYYQGIFGLRFENGLIEPQAQRPAVIRLYHRQRRSALLSHGQWVFSALDRFCYERVPDGVEFSVPIPKVFSGPFHPGMEQSKHPGKIEKVGLGPRMNRLRSLQS
jgi:hypothetical protein